MITAIRRFFAGLSGKTIELISSQDVIPIWAIGVNLGDDVTIDYSQVKIPFTKSPVITIADITDTNSMDGVMDYGHNLILLTAPDEENHKILTDWLNVGDIATYWTGTGTNLHRIVKIKTDAQGKVFTFKGDNNAFADPYRVRPEHIGSLCVGILF